MDSATFWLPALMPAATIPRKARSTSAPPDFLVETVMPERASWDEYFMNIATVVASRSTCPRKYVGAEVGHMMENGHCVATIHAESNAILQAAKNGVMIDGGTLYVTASPCWNCFKQIANCGIRRVVYGEFYRDERIFDVARRLNIELVHLPVAASATSGQD
jgi:dCMP deaminase